MAGKRHKRRQSAFGRGLQTVLSIIAVLMVVVLTLAAWGGYEVTNSVKSLPNLNLNGIEVGGLSRDEIASELQAANWDEILSQPLNVSVPLNISFRLDRSQTGMAVTSEEAAEWISSVGHSGHWLENLELWISAWVSGTVPVTLAEKTPNETYIRANVKAAVNRFDQLAGSGEILLDKPSERITLVKGGGQVRLDEEKIYQAVLEALRGGSTELEYTELEGSVTAPDFAAVYRDVAVEAQDAYFTETFEVVPEVIGCTFDVEEAMRIWENAELGEKVTIPLTTTAPEVRAEELSALLYRDRLCFMTTNYWDSTANRINNIHLAADKLNGAVVLPGQVFSYNNTIGERTEEAGFLLAGAYADGEVIEEVGGGICQVSSTLYCAAMYAQMTTTMRQNHYFAVGYLSMGYDATVSWTSPDYRFRNDREYPVKIVTYYDDHSVTVEFWGTNTDGTHVSPYSKSYEVYDETWGCLIGYGVTTIRQILDANDNVVNTIQEPTGIYHLHDQDIDWPPEKEAADAAAAMGAAVTVFG
ncbi:MAG: VanW family protein [Oscillospiraceae bacterium]|nr:VanW family protein [Oscillospiraceae bacterium]